MDDETKLNADEHVKFTEIVLSSYGKWWNNIAALIGDNCNTNRSMSKKAMVNFIGCASHRFDLAVKDIMVEYDDLVSTVNAIMKKLKNLVPSAKLRKLTPLKPKTRNVTRWSSTHDMLERYLELKQFIPLIKLPEVDDMMPTSRQERDIEYMLKKLRDRDSVTKTLQKEDLNMNDVRDLFDGVIEEFPETSKRLSTNADIIEDPIFESAVVKVLNKKVDELSVSEKAKIAMCKVQNQNGNEENINDSESVSLAERALKRRKLADGADAFLNLNFLRPTSNMCERLFSKAGYVMNDRRQSTLPSNFESQIFLHINAAFWGIEDVNELLKHYL